MYLLTYIYNIYICIALELKIFPLGQSALFVLLFEKEHVTTKTSPVCLSSVYHDQFFGFAAAFFDLLVGLEMVGGSRVDGKRRRCSYPIEFIIRNRDSGQELSVMSFSTSTMEYFPTTNDHPWHPCVAAIINLFTCFSDPKWYYLQR
jgi:hypothetical protein